MNGMGFVIIPELSARTITDVRRAAEAAGFTEEVNDIRGRNVFIRCARELVKTGVLEQGSNGVLRDKLADDECISFQFSKRYIEENKAEYVKAAVVTYDKKTGQLHCEDAAVKAQMLKLIDTLQGLAQTSDIRSFLDRVIREDTRRISIGIASYFISQQHERLVDRLEKFYKSLSFPCVVLPVNHQRASGSIIQHVVDDLKGSVSQLVDEIKALKDKDGMTKRIAKHRVKEMKQALAHYREIAQSLQTSLTDVLKISGEQAVTLVTMTKSPEALIEAAQKGKKLDAIAVELLVAAGELDEGAIPASALKPITAAPVTAGAVPVDVVEV